MKNNKRNKNTTKETKVQQMTMLNHSFIHAGVLTGQAQNGHCQERKTSYIRRFHGDCELCSDPWSKREPFTEEIKRK